MFVVGLQHCRVPDAGSVPLRHDAPVRASASARVWRPSRPSQGLYPASWLEPSHARSFLHSVQSPLVRPIHGVAESGVWHSARKLHVPLWGPALPNSLREALDALSKRCRSSIPGAGALFSGPINAKDSATAEDSAVPSSKADSGKQQSAKSPLRILSGASMIPHPEKAYRGGEDAFFICDDTSAVGVADGVGGWATQGIDPGLFSRQLMQGCEEAIVKLGVRDPIMAMHYALSKVEAPGSSTCCVAILDGDQHVLHGANLGDSGIMVLRGSDIVYRSPEQQHYFNCPYQLGTESTDTPEHSDRVFVQVQEGDLIVTGTDGLWDNVYDHEIISICEIQEPIDGKRAGTAYATELASKLAEKAHELAKSSIRQSPFAVKARQCGYRFFGGKMDDITVIVSSVVSGPAPNRTPSTSSAAAAQSLGLEIGRFPSGKETARPNKRIR
eukprot:tig00021123_g18521.t2